MKIADEYQKIDAHAKQLLSHNDLIQGLQRIARQINQDYQNKNLLCLCVLNGGMVTLGQLLPMIKIPCQLDSVHASRYAGKTSGYQLKWSKYPALSLQNQDVLLIDDILDEGITLYELQNYCRQQGAASVKSAVLINKLHRRKYKNIQANYIACECEDYYIYGFGMDYKEYGRNKDGIYIAQ